jgi:hypothetical protein
MLTPCFLLVTSLAHFSSVKREAVHYYETSVNVYRTTRRHIAEDNTLLYVGSFEKATVKFQEGYRSKGLINVTLMQVIISVLLHKG